MTAEGVAAAIVVTAWVLFGIGLALEPPNRARIARVRSRIVARARRAQCALAPGWHPGFVKTEYLTWEWTGRGATEVTRARHGAFRSRVWTIARCVRCGEREVW